MNVLVRTAAWVELTLYVVWEVVLSSLRVAWEVLTPHATSRPGIIRVPIGVRRVDQIALLAHIVTLTPGTVTLDVTEERDALYVHVMFLDDRDAVIAAIQDGMESRVRKVLP